MRGAKKDGWKNTNVRRKPRPVCTQLCAFISCHCVVVQYMLLIHVSTQPIKSRELFIFCLLSSKSTFCYIRKGTNSSPKVITTSATSPATIHNQLTLACSCYLLVSLQTSGRQNKTFIFAGSQKQKRLNMLVSIFLDSVTREQCTETRIKKNKKKMT